MVSNTSLVLAAIVSLSSSLAYAADDGLSQQFSACMDESGGVTVTMIDCIVAETKRQDSRLNKAYGDLMAQLPPARKKELQEAQRAWIKYRDANCSFYFDPEGGTMARVSSNDCVLSATAARAKELEGFRQ